MDYKKKNIVRILILSAALVFIATGILRGETVEVYKKATEICLACMGIAR